MILLVVPSLNVPKFKGIARISSELAKKIKYDEIYVIYQNLSLLRNNLFCTPLKELISKCEIIHSLVPEAASFLPFMPWKKSIVTFHDFIPIEASKKFKFRFATVSEVYTKIMWRLASKCKVVIANSSQTSKELKKYFNRPADYIINPGVSEYFKPKHLKKDKITLGFFSAFTVRKGVDKAIKVFELVKRKIDCKLVLAGGNPFAFFSRNLDVSRLSKNKKDVEVIGEVKEEELVNLYNSFDFFIFPSMYEGFGLPILEAQACGIPTLIFKNAKIPEETRKKAIKCKDINDMANKIISLIEDKSKYKRIAKEGRKYAKRFTWENYTKQHERIYESLRHR